MVIKAESTCPKCGGELKHYDTVKRIIRTKGRRTEWIRIARVRCTRCGTFHRSLPEDLLPFKQYEAEVIFGVLMGKVWTLMTSNPYLTLFVAAALIPIGVGVFSAIKNAARN